MFDVERWFSLEFMIDIIKVFIVNKIVKILLIN